MGMMCSGVSIWGTRWGIECVICEYYRNSSDIQPRQCRSRESEALPNRNDKHPLASLAKMDPRERREHCRILVATHRQERMTSRSPEVELLRNLPPNWNPLRMRLRILPCIRPGRPQRRSDSFSWVKKLALVFRISIGINPNCQIRCSARCSRQSGQHAQAAAYRQK